MDSTLVVFACVALGAVAGLCLVGISAVIKAGRNLDRITGVVETMQRDVSELKTHTIPVLLKTGFVLDQTHETIASVRADLGKLSKAADSVSGIAQDVRSFEQDIIARIRPSVEDLTSISSGVIRGVTAFIRHLTKR